MSSGNSTPRHFTGVSEQHPHTQPSTEHQSESDGGDNYPTNTPFPESSEQSSEFCSGTSMKTPFVTSVPQSNQNLSLQKIPTAKEQTPTANENQPAQNENQQNIPENQPAQQNENQPAQQNENQPAQQNENQPAQQNENQPAQQNENQPAQNENQPAQQNENQPAQQNEKQAAGHDDTTRLV